MTKGGLVNQQLRFSIERETKNTVRYQEESQGKPPVIGTLYVQKWALGIDVPTTLVLTLTAETAPTDR